MTLPLRLLCAFAALLLAGCAETAQVTPAGDDTFAITVEAVEEPGDTPEAVEKKLRELFQAKAEKITDGRKYERYELVSYETTRLSTGARAKPIARGTIRCFR